MFFQVFYSICLTEYYNERKQHLSLYVWKTYQVLEGHGSNMASKMAAKHENHNNLQIVSSTE